jgi:predicted DNA-binding protein
MRLGQRVGFYLTDLQIKNLKAVSKKTGLTVSEIIRRAVDEHLEKYIQNVMVRYDEETKPIKPNTRTVKMVESKLNESKKVKIKVYRKRS